MNLGTEQQALWYFNSSYSYPPLCSGLENQQPTITVGTSSLAATGMGKAGMEILQSPIPKELSLFYLFGGSLEDATQEACLHFI